ncbi:MAG: DUF5320 domain-containing protein [Phycisphaerae bacterium]|nr:DUF5320 domain-containing protein [Phycisphaerae bacterium]
MPGGDQTGPMGLGPMSGRGMGRCAGFAGPGFANPMPGRGFGMGRGRGRGRGRGMGWGRGYAFGAEEPVSAPAPSQEVDWLKAQAERLGESLAEIQRRLDAIESAEGRPDAEKA